MSAGEHFNLVRNHLNLGMLGLGNGCGMSIPQQNLIEIIASEHRLVLDAPSRHGRHYEHALEASFFLSNFVNAVDPGMEVFLMWMSQVKKHHLLALLSVVRLHHIQGTLDLRYTIEAATCAAYAIEHPSPLDFSEIDADGLLSPSQKNKTKQYKWLDKHFPAISKDIKGIKDLINQNSAHANLVNTSLNCLAPQQENYIAAPFFDVTDEYYVRADLWRLANTARAIIALICQVAEGRKGIRFHHEFASIWEKLVRENDELLNELKQSDPYKRAMARAEAKEETAAAD
jgi:hypothetical protein